MSLLCSASNAKKVELELLRREIGTIVIVIQYCDKCGDKAFKWHSKPLIFGKYQAGNLLSFPILMAGASVSKVLHICNHMALFV